MLVSPDVLGIALKAKVGEELICMNVICSTGRSVTNALKCLFFRILSFFPVPSLPAMHTIFVSFDKSIYKVGFPEFSIRIFICHKIII